MADVNRGNRPLSPHLSIYKPQLTSITSILTRITGNAMLVAALMIVWWITPFVGDLIMLGSVWALWYHYLAGLRHLYWDTGRGLDIETAENLGKACIIGSFVLTLLTIIVV